jgi:hypothetical protein
LTDIGIFHGFDRPALRTRILHSQCDVKVGHDAIDTAHRSRKQKNRLTGRIETSWHTIDRGGGCGRRQLKNRTHIQG